MATRRRPINPQGQQPVTRVVSQPVDTFVDPGQNVGAPALPVFESPPAPLPQNQFIDLQNLSQSFGQLSSSLAQLGVQNARSERIAYETEQEKQREAERSRQQTKAQFEELQRLEYRAEALKRRDDADARREQAALEARQNQLIKEMDSWYYLGDINSNDALKTLVPQFDAQVAAENIDLKDDPTFLKKFSTAQALRIAANLSETDIDELAGLIARQDPEIRSPGGVKKWWDQRTLASVDDIPDWVPDKDRFRYTYINQRNRLFQQKARSFQAELKKQQYLEDQENLKSLSSAVINSYVDGTLDNKDRSRVVLDFDFETLTLKERPSDIEATLKPEEAAARQLTEILDEARFSNTMTGQMNNETMGTVLVERLKNSTTVQEMDSIEDIINRVQTGPQDNRSNLVTQGSFTRRLLDSAKPELDKKRQDFAENEAKKAFQQQFEDISAAIVNQSTLMFQGGLMSDETAVSDIPQYFSEVLDPNAPIPDTDPDAAVKREFRDFFTQVGARAEAKRIVFTDPFTGKEREISYSNIIDEAQTKAYTASRSSTLNRLRQPAETPKTEDGAAFNEKYLGLFADAVTIREQRISARRSVVRNSFTRRFRELVNSQNPEDFEAAFQAYKMLSKDQAYSTDTLGAFIGEDMKSLMELVDILVTTKTVPSAKNLDEISALFQEDTFNPETLRKRLNEDKSSSTGNGTRQDEVDAAVRRASPEINNIDAGYPILDEIQKAAEIAAVLSPEKPATEIVEEVIKLRTAGETSEFVEVNVGTQGIRKMSFKGIPQSLITGFSSEEPTRIHPMMLRDPLQTSDIDLSKLPYLMDAYREHFRKRPTVLLSGGPLNLLGFGKLKKTRVGPKFEKWRDKAYELESAIREAEGKQPFSKERSDQEWMKAYVPDSMRRFTMDTLISSATKAVQMGSKVTRDSGDAGTLTKEIASRGIDVSNLYFKLVPNSGGEQFYLVNGESFVGREGGVAIWSISEVNSLAQATHRYEQTQARAGRLEKEAIFADRVLPPSGKTMRPMPMFENSMSMRLQLSGGIDEEAYAAREARSAERAAARRAEMAKKREFYAKGRFDPVKPSEARANPEQAEALLKEGMAKLRKEFKYPKSKSYSGRERGITFLPGDGSLFGTFNYLDEERKRKWLQSPQMDRLRELYTIANGSDSGFEAYALKFQPSPGSGGPYIPGRKLFRPIKEIQESGWSLLSIPEDQMQSFFRYQSNPKYGRKVEAEAYFRKFLSLPAMEGVKKSYKFVVGDLRGFKDFALLFYPGPEPDVQYMPRVTQDILKRFPKDGRNRLEVLRDYFMPTRVAAKKAKEIEAFLFELIYPITGGGL